MPLDARPSRQRSLTDDEIDRLIMQGSPFAMPAVVRAGTPAPRAMELGDVLRGLFALAMVFGAVAGIGVVMLGLS
jgi:hypothetical protein